VSRKVAAIGLALVAVYGVVLAITLSGRDGVRPLYDGFAPPARYRFVDPPPFFAAGNEQPEAATATVALRANGSAPISVSTGDGQVALNLAPAAVPAHGADRHVRVTITPESAEGVGRLPGGLRTNGNVYRVNLRYEPSGAPVRAVRDPGTLLVALPEVGESFFRSDRGRVWSAVDADALPPRNLSITTPFDGPGFYVSGTQLPLLPGPPAEGSSSVALVAGVGAAVLVVVLVGVGVLLRRRRHRSV
jgi:hypothetical protein